jgi:hypothetical protein
MVNVLVQTSVNAQINSEDLNVSTQQNVVHQRNSVLTEAPAVWDLKQK